MFAVILLQRLKSRKSQKRRKVHRHRRKRPRNLWKRFQTWSALLLWYTASIVVQNKTDAFLYSARDRITKYVLKLEVTAELLKIFFCLYMTSFVKGYQPNIYENSSRKSARLKQCCAVSQKAVSATVKFICLCFFVSKLLEQVLTRTAS